MGAHAASTYRILAGTCVFLNVLLSSVIGQVQIPDWDNPKSPIILSEDTPVGTVIGSLKLINGDGLMITSESTFVSVANPQSGPGYIAVDIILNTILDYDSGVRQLNCIFKGVNKDFPSGKQLEVKVIVTNVNDESPHLENQPYSISVREDAANGSSIYTFTSKDLDPSDTPIFSLTAHAQAVDDEYKNKFAVDSATGQLRLMGKLDFESVRFYEYTVIVKDQVGHNNTAQVFITILDVQDTPPFFTGEPFQTKMNESTTVNTSLLHVTASDGDRGAPNDILFSVISDSCGSLFKMDSKSGSISLKSQADRDIGLVSSNNGVCILGVEATEGNQHPQSNGSLSTASTSVTITVVDINDNVPSFSNTTYTVQVDENTQAGVPINIKTPISVSDADQGNNAKFDVTITKLKEYFEVTPSQVQSAGEILIRVTNSTILDYEKNHNLTLKLEARDALGSTTATVTIIINNVNDNSPIFNSPAYVGNVNESSGQGTPIITITATDADASSGTDNFNKVTYSLEPSDSSFKIDNVTGEVMVDQVKLDREARSVYYVTVVAKDGGGSKASALLEIRVLDLNDQKPEFVTTDYQTSLNEGSTTFSRVITVQATDNDEPHSSNSNVTYKILPTTSPSGLASNFHITTNGILTVTSALDFEGIFHQGDDGKITLTVEADDQGNPVQSSTVSVIIFLQDINDHDPLCAQGLYSTSILENSTRFSKIIQVGAHDEDGTKPNNVSMFSIDQESAGKFIMDSSTGWLTLRDMLDREQKESYSINVTVTDLGIPSRSGSCQVSVTVDDINDSPPVFDQKQQVAFNAIENKPGQVFPVSAHDPDSNPNLFYNISWQDCTAQGPTGQTTNPSVLQSWVYIDHKTGEVKSLKALDREKISEFTLHIFVVDDKAEVNRPQTDTATITITVIDENDEAPHFTGGHSYTASIQENMPAGSDIRFDNRASLEIFDADEGVNSQFSVQLLTFNKIFSISPNTGTSTQAFTISVIDSSALDYENTTYFIIEVLAVDINDGSKKDSATITVNITNENDNIPQFSGSPPYTASLLENSTDGTTVYNVDATDDDRGIFGIVEYFLEDKFKTFDIDNTTGEVFLSHGNLDRENIPEYTVTLIAKDKGNFRATTQLVISVTDVNDKAPKFTKNPYSLNIDEETRAIPAFSVLATDDDDPNSPNSKVKYSLMNANGEPYSFFSIDPTSGTLTLSSTIDCEDSYKACDGALTLNVQATDQGTPSNSDNTTIKITVMDTNDNAPKFSPSVYTTSVREDALPNKLVLTVTATDKDVGIKNNQVYYSLDTLSNKTFSIDANGKITVKDKLDRETTSHYTVIVTAQDNGMPIQTSTALVEIDVDDVNDESPTFSRSSLSVTKQENTNDLIAQNVANDPDQNNELHYSIVWADSSGMDGAGRYIPGTLLNNYISINETTGEVFPVGELDREKAQRFQLTLFVKDQNGITPQNDTAILTIIVQDINDASPTFQGGNHFTGTIQENMPKDSEVKMINISALIISDGDSGNNSMYNIALDDISVFKISPSKGDGNTTCVISVVNPLKLDYEKQQSFTLKVIAIESNTVERYNNTATVTVLIENVDDEIPQFSSPFFEVSIHENSSIGDSVTTMSATDEDLGEFGIIEYYIDGPQTGFTIDNKTGLVRVNTTLDRETKDSYTVTVKARDIKNYEGSTQLTVRVTDVNDEKPEFQETSYAAEVVENQDFFKVPLVVKATDKDEANTINSQISYSITKIPPNFSPGSLYINDKTGEINFTSPAPDYEFIFAQNGGFFQIEVTATDGGKPSQHSSVMVNVTVRDSNDKNPEFNPNSYHGNVLENSPEGVSIVTVTASDGDGTSPNNEFYYVIQSGSRDKFQINSSTGEITVGVGAALDREGVDKDDFKLIVLAIDKGTPAQTGTAIVTIAVRDVNDSPPTISPTEGLFYVYENESVNTQITSFNASDPDEYPELRFDVLWAASHAYDEKEKETNQNLIQAWLQIDPVSGVITVKSEMDRETVEQMVIKVIVEDKNASSNLLQVVTATVTVSILDVNDNPPVISSTGDTLNLNISEGTKVNTEVATLTANDADKGQTVTFSLENTNSNFSISKSGKLQLIGKLDRETQPELNFIVVATDSGSPAMSSNITVNIIVLDINDNDPQFHGTNFTFSVRENSDNTTLVATIKADDDDDGDNKNVTFEFKDISPFYINPITGEIYVSGELDRESVQTHILTVIAADNPSLESRRRASTQIKIIIEDVNDNYPIFKHTEYTGRISEERKVGESVTILPSAISATDNDEGDNAKITYLLMDSDDFGIDPVTGDVKVKRSILDKSADYSYIVNATDGGSPALWAVVNLTITIIDANNHYPEFVDKGPISIPECAQHGKNLYTFLAKDNDTDQTTNAKVQYKLFDGAGSNDSRLFQLDPDSGVLTTAKGDPSVPLFNHNTRPELMIEVLAVDNGDPPKSSDRVRVTIKVTDINDNVPEFDKKNVTFHVKEEQEGVIVGTVKAFDKDENTQLAYDISGGDLGWKDYFFIVTDPDPDKGGIIHINKSLDREMLDKFVIKVIAIDLAQQTQDALCDNLQQKPINPNSQPQEVVLMVDDINDNPPVFTKKSLAIGFLSSTEFGKILTFLQNFVQDKDQPPNSLHKFYQLGEATPDKELSKTWDTTIMPDPIKVDLNGTLSTNYKFSIGSSGYFTMKILVNDSAGDDVINMKIYVVGESQVVHLTLWQTEDNLRKVQDEITKQLSQMGYEFVPDNILPAYREDGTVDNSKSVLVTHAIDSDGNIVTGKKLISILDESPVMTGVQNNFKISKTESGEDVGKMVNDNTEERMRYILIAIIAVIAATFVITLGLLLHNIRKFKRKLKAATIEVHGLDQMKRASFPGLDNHDIKSANPLFGLMNNVGFDGNYDADNADTLSQNSQNSLDQNAVVSRDPGTKAKPAIDEQEVTLDMYGNDDVGAHSSGLYSDLDFSSPEPLQDNVSPTDEKTWRFNDTSDENNIQQILDLNKFEFTEI